MWYEKTAMTLAAIGAINWGLTIFGANAVEMLLGWAGMVVINIVYGIVALCGIYTLFLTFSK
ncbi:MAG: DUF378 domain-containing protein [Candidatus Pacearchaeota archaeon]|nr:DUF378 domain-containing protein [Candidatus Pacearchaeota archaeon]